MADTPQNIPSKVIILVAAGRGSRAGEGLPKQYREICGKPLIRHTLDALRLASVDAAILPVIHPDDKEMFEEAAGGVSSILSPVNGGVSRQESVFNGLQALANQGCQYVYIHDAARPFVSKALMDRIDHAFAEGAAGVVPAVPVVDTLVRAQDGARKPVDRSNIFAVQTPQAFIYDEIFAAHKAAIGQALTDDASVYEASGGAVMHVAGEEANFKVTCPEDFMKAEQMLNTPLTDIRVGSGYDVHRFEPGNSLWLCGVELAYTMSLRGHSDADVALHALTDALLAAISDGDIGAHFPPSDEQWRGAPSDRFLSFAADRVKGRGGRINHLGVTIICEVPKIRPHVEAMRHRIGEIAQISVDRVSVQATTTEKLGFTGRGEGIAAQATATVALPFGETP